MEHKDMEHKDMEHKDPPRIEILSPKRTSLPRQATSAYVNKHTRRRISLSTYEYARIFTRAQRSQTWKKAVTYHPKALFWCFYSLFSCIMWGYDGLAGTIVLAVAPFRHDYGTEFPAGSGQFVLPAIAQLGLAAASLVGLLLGGIGAGILTKKWGRQLCISISYLFTIGGVFLQWFSSPGNLPILGNLPMLVGGKFLTGLPLGVFITIAPTYCAEIAPFALRGAVTSAVNWSIVFGQCLAYVVMRQTQFFDDANSYRIMFAIQWLFALIALVFLPFFPESPYLLMSQNKNYLAYANTKKLYGPDFDVTGYLSSITLDLEKQEEAQKATSFTECFRGKNTLRTLIAMSTMFIQAMSGIGWIVGYMAYFLQLGGLTTARAFDVTVVLSFVMLFGNMIGWIFVERFGRRPTALYGCITLATTLIMIGIAAVIPYKGAIWIQVGFMVVYSFTYQSTIGSVAWPIISEVAKSSLRGHTQSLATVASGIAGAIAGIGLPFAMNPDQGNMMGKLGFIYGGALALSCVGVFLFYPETKGRTFEEIDRLFEQGVNPRRFTDERLESIEEHPEG